jgi:branched-chain amino acid transport system permease protein
MQMRSLRYRDFRLDIWSIVLLLPLLVVPLTMTDPLANSLTYQSAIGISAAMAIYIMLRLGLLSFMVPAFMGVGGYAGAMLAKAGVTDLTALLMVTFAVPALVAIPLGLLVLRLQGIYFIFITFLFNEILQLVIFETPGLTGGSNGISEVPSATFLGTDLSGSQALVLVTVIICLVAALCTLWVTQRFRAEFTSIQENETLTESFGVAIWKYRTIGFVASAGVAGLAGFALVNTLATANPSSFASWSVNNYIAYAFVGGRFTMLGMVVGSVLLIVMNNVFAAYAQFSAGLYGILIIVVMMAFPGGIVGTIVKLFDNRRARAVRPTQNFADEKQA